jgi:predicted phage terminase large subunit-like protein
MASDVDDLPIGVREQLIKTASPANVALWLTRNEPKGSANYWRRAKHLDYLNGRLLRALSDRENQTFLNVQASVRHGKSELLTIWACVWFMAMFPGSRVLIATGDKSLSPAFSSRIRDIFKEHGQALFGVTLKPGAQAVDEWALSNGSSMRAVTVGTNIVGMGYDLIIIEDPIASAKDAHSDVIKKNLVDWYMMAIRTRLQTGGTMLFTMARWAEDDLSGTVVEMAGATGDPWEVIKLPAIAEAPQGADDDWRDPIGRREGEALWPELWPLEVLERIRASITAEAWNALYQQNPVPPTGNLFERERWGDPIPRPPDDQILSLVRAWDLAATAKKGADWTVGLLMAKLRGNRTAILDVQRFRGDPGTVEHEILTTAELDGSGVMVRLEIEKAGAGKLTDHHYSQLLPHRDFEAVGASGDKEERARLMASAQKRRMISLVGGDWNEEFISEAEKFPNGRFDDQVDAASYAYNVLWDVGESALFLPGAYVSTNVNGLWTPEEASGIPGMALPHLLLDFDQAASVLQKAA